MLLSAVARRNPRCAKLWKVTAGERRTWATRSSETLSGEPVAGKLPAQMKRRLQDKVVNLGDAITGRAAAEDLQGTVATTEDLAALRS
jgi:hypothetical protein